MKIKTSKIKKTRALFAGIVSTLALSFGPPPVLAQGNIVQVDIDAQPLAKALIEYAEQTDIVVMAPAGLVEGKATDGVEGVDDPELALDQLLASTGLAYRFINDRTISIQAIDVEVARDPGNAATTPRLTLMAQAPENEEREPVRVEEIIVTGSNIRGIAPDSSPLFVYDRDDIDRTGLSTVEQLIESLPQNFGGGVATDTFTIVPESRDAAGNFSRGSSVNLRGLGSDATLVLLNGRRLPPTVLSAFVDISIIPLSAIERVEVLTDGASAIYGSDAVAGVVNFVLRDDFEGAETLLRYGTVTEGGLDEYKASQTFGRNWESGNALFVYEYFNQDSLPAADRSFAREAGTPPDFDLLPKVERHSVFASISQDVTDRIEVFADGLYANRDTEAISDNFGFSIFGTSDTEQFSLSAGGSVGISDDWVFQIAGSYGEDEALIFSEFTTLDISSERRFTNSLWTIDAKADGTVYELPGGDLRLAVGMGYRDEALEDFRITSTTDFRLDRDVLAVYGELFIPLLSEKNGLPGIERLELSVAGRFEDYSDFGSSTDPKIGLLWSPLPGLNLRGTYGTSFRAPNLDDLNPDSFEAILSNVADPNVPDGTSLLLFLSGKTGEIGPEESTAWTFGLDYEPEFAPNLQISATYYDIEFDDRIDQPSTNFLVPITQPDVFAPVLTFDPTPQQIADTLAAAPVFRNFTVFPGFGPPGIPEDAEVILNNTLQNISSTDTRGIDLSILYSVETDIGDFGFGLGGTYIFDFERAITETAPIIDIVDTVFNPPDLRFRVNSSWSKGGLLAAVFVNHTSGYMDNIVTPEIEIDAWTTVDLSLSFDTQGRFESGFLNDIRVSVSVQNVFDNDPPFVQGDPSFNSVGFDPANATSLNRFIAVQIGKAW